MKLLSKFYKSIFKIFIFREYLCVCVCVCVCKPDFTQNDRGGICRVYLNNSSDVSLSFSLSGDSFKTQTQHLQKDQQQNIFLYFTSLFVSSDILEEKKHCT